MRIAILDAPAGSVVNIIEAASLARAQLFHPFCRLATASDNPPGITLDAQGQKDQADAVAARSYAKLVTLTNMSPAQIQTWVTANVTDLATAKDAILTLAVAVSVLGRRI